MLQGLDQIELFTSQNDVQNIKNDIRQLDHQLEQLQIEENALKEKNLNQQNSQQQYDNIKVASKGARSYQAGFPESQNGDENMVLDNQNEKYQQVQLRKQMLQYQIDRSDREQPAQQQQCYESRTEEIQLKELKHKLRTLFTFYASFGDRINVDFLKSNNFHKMMVDAKLRDNQLLTQNRLDLMFIKENKHKLNMEFDTFLNLLAKIADMKYSNADSSAEALSLLLQNHFLPLYDNIINETDLGEDEIKFKEEIDEGTLMLVKNIQSILQKIYLAYFPWEPKVKFDKAKTKSQSEKALFQFLKDFDICPTLVTKSTAFLLFSEIIEISVEDLCQSSRIQSLAPYLGGEIGNVLTFSRFCVYLIRIGNICYQNFYNNVNENECRSDDASTTQKFQFLLERMELSQGFINLQKLLHVPINSQTSLILKKKITKGNMINKDYSPYKRQQIDQLQPARQIMKSKSELTLNVPSSNKESFPPQSRNERQNQPGQLFHQIKQQIRDTTPTQDNQYMDDNDALLSNFKSSQGNAYAASSSKQATFLQEGSSSVFDRYHEQLTKIFQIYCSFGDPTNMTRMKSNKFQKLLKDCRLINQSQRPGGFLSQQQRSTQDAEQNENGSLPILYIEDTDLIFVKLLNNKKRELDLQQFYLALEMIALRLFGSEDLQSGLQLILENYVLKLLDRESNIRSNNQYIQVLMEILQDQAVVELLGLVHRSIMNYYKYYADKSGRIFYDRFEKFCKDFGIFPEILPKAKLFKIFSTLSQIYQTTETQNSNNQFQTANRSSTSRLQGPDSKQMLKIDQHLFVESLALCAFEIQFSDPQPTSIEKICYLLERMNHSEGPKIVQRQLGVTRCQTGANWDLLSQVRKKYPFLFLGNEDQQQKSGETFDQIMRQQKMNM